MKNKKIKKITLLGIVPVVFILLCVFVYLRGGRYVETDNAYVRADIIPISAEVSGIINILAVRENQRVDKGDLLFQINPQPYLVAVSKSDAKLGEVKAHLESLRSSYEEKQAGIVLAEKNLEFAQRELQRQIDLQGKNFVSASVLDNLRHAVETAEQQINVLNLDLKTILASLGGDINAPLSAHPSYKAALAELNSAELDLTYTEVLAPSSGVVSNVPISGQYVREGNMMMALVADDNFWVEANFTEKDLTNLEMEQEVAIRVDTYPDARWQGSIESISPATGAEFAILPPQNATGNWVKVAQRVPVKIKIKNTEDSPGLRSGLSAVVRVDTKKQRELLGFHW
ncbi:HlyD family secretion protein [Aurantivibrio infirmus]